MNGNRDVERDFVYLLLYELAMAALAQKNYLLADLIGTSIEEIRWGVEQDSQSLDELTGMPLETLAAGFQSFTLAA